MDLRAGMLLLMRSTRLTFRLLPSGSILHYLVGELEKLYAVIFCTSKTGTKPNPERQFDLSNLSGAIAPRGQEKIEILAHSCTAALLQILLSNLLISHARISIRDFSY